MPLFQGGETLSQKDFAKGIDRESPRTMIKEGGYEDAQNMLLSNPATGGKHGFSMFLDVPLDANAAWPLNVNLIWTAPFTDSTYFPAIQTLVFNTHILAGSDAGQVFRYVAPVTGATVGTISNTRRGFLGANRQINHFAYDQWLCLVDGRNAPMKYGQHFLWNTQGEQGAFMYPLGSRPVSPIIATVVGETWIHTGGLNSFKPDGSVPQGSRVDIESLLLYPNATSSSTSLLKWNYASTTTTSATSIATGLGAKTFTVATPTGPTFVAGEAITVSSVQNPTVTMTGTVTAYSAPTLTINVTATTGSGTFANWAITGFGVVDFTAPPQPYGGNSFVSTDFLVCSFVGSVQGQKSTGTVEIRFQQDATNYFSFLFTPNADTTAWVTQSQTISAATQVGTPTWASITSVKFINNDPATPLFIDDLYFLYQNAPPAIQVACAHKNRIVGGGAPVFSNPVQPTLTKLVWSNAGNPDNFPSANVQNMSGGIESLARTNNIAAVREYIDTVIVGMPQAIFSWTIGDTGNPVKSTISTEHGIDSHRGIVETPSGSLIFPWQHGIYILRSTGRQYISAKIDPILNARNGGVFEDAPQWWMSVVDEKTKTVRIAYRAGATDPGANNSGIVFDYVRAQDSSEPVFPSTFTQVFDFAAPAYINGDRETIYVKNGSNQIFRMHNQASGTIQSSITLPWESLDKKMFMEHWVGAVFPYAATAPVKVFVRYASNPGEFDSAPFTLMDTLPANPDQTIEGRVSLSGADRWAQIKLVCESVGFEIYPPVQIISIPTQRMP